MRIIKIAILVMFTLSLSGCGKGMFRDRSEDYEKAQSYPALKIPKDCNAERFNDEYNIPK